MLVKAPYSIRAFSRKVEVIRYIKKTFPKNMRYLSSDKSFVAYVLNEDYFHGVKEVERGIYVPKYLECGDLSNAHLHFTEGVSVDEYPELYSGNCYGVCDGVSNFMSVYGEEITSSKDWLFVMLTPVYKKYQSSCGGWRWHKWGAYVGTQVPTEEYLYDEKDIEVVWLYHIYKIENVNLKKTI